MSHIGFRLVWGLVMVAVVMVAVMGLGSAQAWGQSDPQLSITVGQEYLSGADRWYAELENSVLRVKYHYFELDIDTSPMMDLIDKDRGSDQAEPRTDAISGQGELKSATLIYDGDDRKTVRLVWYSTGEDVISEVSVFPNSKVLRIDYIAWNTTIYDLCKVNGQGGCTAYKAYGQDSWIRSLLKEQNYVYYNRYRPVSPYDGAYPDGGSLNYNGWFILGQYRGETGMGRVVPVWAIETVKESNNAPPNVDTYSGWSIHPCAGLPHEPFSSYFYMLNDTTPEDDVVPVGQDVVDSWVGNAVAGPSFTPSPGTYSGATSVQLTSATTGAQIRYTTDGSEPTEAGSPIYSGPIVLSEGITEIRAKAYKVGMNPSLTSSGVFIMNTTGKVTVIPETMPVSMYGYSVGYEIDTTFSLSNMSSAYGAALALEMFDVDDATEAKVYVNGNELTLPGSVIGDGSGGALSDSLSIPLAYLSDGSNTLKFRFNNAPGGTSGYWADASVSVDYPTGPADDEAPSKPTNLHTTAVSDSGITLEWTESTDNNDVAGYYVYRDGGSVGIATGPSYTDAGLSPCSDFTYTVVAYDTALPTANTSLPSDPLATGTEGAAQSANLDGVGGVDIDDLGVMAGNWLGSGRVFCVPGDLNGDGLVGLADFSSLAGAWTGTDTEPPSVPTGLATTGVTHEAVSLAWNDSTDTVAVGGYRVYRDGGSIGTVADTGYTDSGLAVSTAYTYRVSAFDTADPVNESGQSSPLVVTTTGAEVVVNGGFETSAWNDWQQAGSAAWSTSDPYQGSYCIQVTGPEETFIKQDPVTVPSNGSYTLSAWMKITGTTNPDDYMFVRYVPLDPGGADWGWDTKARYYNAGDWTQFSTTHSAAAGTGRIDCYWRLSAGDGRFDNVSMTLD